MRWSLLLFLLSCASSSPRPAGTAVRTLEGETFVLRPRPRPLLMAFGASWCRPCVYEWPQLMRLEDEYQVDVLFLLLEESDALLPQLKQYFAGRSAADGHTLAHRLRVDRLPQLVLFDEKGEVVWREVGYKPSSIGELQDRLADRSSDMR